MPLDQCKLIDLPKITDPRGNLTFIENGRHIPFDIKRVYYRQYPDFIRAVREGRA